MLTEKLDEYRKRNNELLKENDRLRDYEKKYYDLKKQMQVFQKHEIIPIGGSGNSSNK